MSGRVWIVSELYYPEQNATGRILTQIAESMAVHFSVGAICAQPTYDARGTKAPRREMRNGVEIHRVWGTTLDKNVLPFRLLNAATTSLSMYRTARKCLQKGDAVLVVTNPPTMPAWVLRAAKAKEAKVALLVHDVYPEALVRTGIASSESGVVQRMAKSSRTLFSGVDRVVVLGRDMRAVVEAKGAALKAPIDIIENYADLEEVFPIARSDVPMLAELGLADQFVVQHAGNMGRTHGLETVVEAAEQLGPDSGFAFTFVGSGARRKWIAEQAQRLANVHAFDYFPRDRLNESLNACDVALISFLPRMAGISVPSRMYNVLASGKPIVAVCDLDSELALVVQEEKVGWVVAPGDPGALASALQKARSSIAERLEMGARARHAAETKYSLGTIMGRYKQLFESMLSSCPPLS